MKSIERANTRMGLLMEKSKFEKMLGVSAVLTELLAESQVKPIIVGGLAVELYTQSDYTTVDIDMVISDRSLAEDYLLKLGFVPEGRHWYHEKLMVSIEVPGSHLEGADEERVIEIKLNDDENIYVIGIEDIILDRSRACVHCKSTSDCEWGKRMLLLHRKRLDMEYLKKTAELDLTKKCLDKWLGE